MVNPCYRVVDHQRQQNVQLTFKVVDLEQSVSDHVHLVKRLVNDINATLSHRWPQLIKKLLQGQKAGS